MVNDNRIQLIIYELGGEEIFPSLLPNHSKWVNGALFLYDITDPSTLSDLSDWVRIVREQAGNIPIMLVGTKLHLAQYRVITREEGINIAEWYNLSSYIEVSSSTGVHVEHTFEFLVEMIMDNLSNSNLTLIPQVSEGKNPLTEILLRDSSIIPPEMLPKPPEFKINERLTLKLEDGETNIYVNGIAFTHCKYLLFQVPVNNIREYDKLDSIDEAAEILEDSLEEGTSYFTISPEAEFWGHCSNLQAWYEHNYDTRLLHRNLAFHLLRALSNANDPLAKKVFKEEIAKRLETGYPSVVFYLIENQFIDQLSNQELDTLFESSTFLENLEEWFFNSPYIVPEWLFHKIRNKLIKMAKNKSIKVGNLSLEEVYRKLNLIQINEFLDNHPQYERHS
jgi:GTPase SAR1 family protein